MRAEPPGPLLAELPPDLSHDLAAQVHEPESTFGLLSGHAYWDGAEPEAADDSQWRDGSFYPRGRNAHRNDPGAQAYEFGRGGA